MPVERPTRRIEQHRRGFLGVPDSDRRARKHAPPAQDTSAVSSGTRQKRARNGTVDGHQHVVQSPLEAENDHLKLQIRNLQNQLEQSKKELSTAKQELESNRVFDSQADGVSETDIKDQLSALNDSVYQLSSTIAGEWDESELKVLPNPPSQKAASFFGEPLYQLAMDFRTKPDHASMLVSLQTCLSHFSASILSSAFSSLVNPEKTEILQHIFDNVKASQSMPVSARWRSLAHLHGQTLLHDQQGLCLLLMGQLTELHGIPIEMFESKYGEEVSTLVNVALSLRKTMYGEYVSGDVEVLYFPPTTVFDAKKMEVDDPKGATKAASGPILCTTAVGLARTLHHRKRQGDKWVYEDQYGTLVPAKILMNLD
ncbi:hypothetical protein APHAL10511_003524 [Amanita phalloides]|nr:hypothetical protein APHAL10511_003524 [Amanita phalloides]